MNQSIAALVISLFFCSSAFAHIDSQWTESGHLELGEVGSASACAALGIAPLQCPNRRILRLDKNLMFRYGEIVAAADFYQSADEFYADEQTGIKNVIRCAYKRLKEQATDGEPSAGCEFEGFLNIRGYFEVISENYDHFGWNNMKAYVRYHEAALIHARSSYLVRKSNPAQSRKLLDHALILNGFADHFLTDSFAAGHIRLPRIQLKNWAKDNLSGFFKETRGNGLAIVLHDSESRNLKTGAENGFDVANSRGDKWKTRSDENLHIDQNSNDPTFTMPVKAVQASFTEFLKASREGVIVSGKFAATDFVPFAQDKALIEKLTESHQKMPMADIIDALYSALSFFPSLMFGKSDFEEMIPELPSIYATFRADIAEDVRLMPELTNRLPPAYIEAYLNVK